MREIKTKRKWNATYSTKHRFLSNQTDQVCTHPVSGKRRTHTNLSFTAHSLSEATDLLRSENNIGQTMWPLGPRIVIVHDFSFLIVDLLALFVAHQQHHAAEEEDRGAPTHSVRPAKLPYRPVTLVQFGGEAHRIYDQGDEYWYHCNKQPQSRRSVFTSSATYGPNPLLSQRNGSTCIWSGGLWFSGRNRWGWSPPGRWRGWSRRDRRLLGCTLQHLSFVIHSLRYDYDCVYMTCPSRRFTANYIPKKASTDESTVNYSFAFGLCGGDCGQLPFTKNFRFLSVSLIRN